MRPRAISSSFAAIIVCDHLLRSAKNRTRQIDRLDKFVWDALINASLKFSTV